MVKLKWAQQSHLRSMSILPPFNSYLTLRFFLIGMHFDIIHGMLWNFLRLDAVSSSRQLLSHVCPAPAMLIIILAVKRSPQRSRSGASPNSPLL